MRQQGQSAPMHEHDGPVPGKRKSYDTGGPGVSGQNEEHRRGFCSDPDAR
jgi:hypothetical protein